MLNIGADRIDFRQLFSPPSKYNTSFAVGTTYSLDLETLIATCAIIGLNVEADAELIKSPLHMFEAIRRASGKLLIFCQSGQIKTPNKPNKLLPLLENSVSEVSLPNKKRFHPKTWFIKYVAEGLPDTYRLLVMSRNLTFDRSWDVALRLDSVAEGESDPILEQYKTTGEAMRVFLRWLHKKAGAHNSQLKSKRMKLLKLADEVEDLKWRSIGREFDGFDFIPYGINGPSTDKLFDSFHKLLIISPFLSTSVIQKFKEKRLVNPGCTLITRNSELCKLNKDLLTAFETYTIKDAVVGGEECISETGDFKTQDIHAKVYLRTKWSNSELCVGSANATHSAFFGGNVECLISLWGKQRYLSIDKLKRGLFGPDEKTNPFEKVEAKEYAAASEDAENAILESVVRDFCALRKSAVVSGKENFTITVTIEPFQSRVEIALSPLMRAKQQPIRERMLFADLALRDLSEWYVVTAKTQDEEVSRVMKIQTKGIPDCRDSAVFSEIVRDKAAFLTYIAFLLSDDYLAAFLESVKKGKGDFHFLNMSFDSPILYERMLKAAANDKASLREIRAIIALAGDNVVPQEFLKLYEQFEKVAY